MCPDGSGRPPPRCGRWPHATARPRVVKNILPLNRVLATQPFIFVAKVEERSCRQTGMV